jgi:hypothetical protein
MKIIITESQYRKSVDKFISYQLEPHEEKFSKRYPNSKFWVKYGKIIAEIDKKDNYFWVDYNVWMTISSICSLGYDETEKNIKHCLEEHYKLDGLTPIRKRLLVYNRWKYITNWED